MLIKQVTRSGDGGHIIVPKDWRGKTARVTIIEEQEEPIKSKKEIKTELEKFERQVKCADRLQIKTITIHQQRKNKGLRPPPRKPQTGPLLRCASVSSI